MRKILNAMQMRAIDRCTIEERGIPGIVLMENAGASVYEVLEDRFSPLRTKRLFILAGKGNNGGDGLIAARHMIVRGEMVSPMVVLVADPDELNDDAALAYRMLQAVDCEPILVKSSGDWKRLRSQLLPAEIIVDALLGTGLRAFSTGLYHEIIKDINTHFNHCEIVSVDMPSGLPTDSGDPAGEALRASTTVTFTAPKISQIFPPNCDHVGDLVIKQIGITPSSLEKKQSLNLAYTEKRDFEYLFAPRKTSAHKGNFGHVFVIGGSLNTPGAVLMASSAAKAALKAGAGLVTTVTTENVASTLIANTPELMTLNLPTDTTGHCDPTKFNSSLLDRATVLALGPGLGVSSGSTALVKKIIHETRQPLVIDADGLNAIADSDDCFVDDRILILTPHPGEMARLTGLSTVEIQARRIEIARNYAVQHNCYVVLKGQRTLVAKPDGLVLVNLTGTPGMATAGSGDVLTGMISGLLAQFPDEPTEIVVSGAVFLHGLSAELAVESNTESTMIATDILRFLPSAIKTLINHSS